MCWNGGREERLLAPVSFKQVRWAVMWELLRNWGSKWEKWLTVKVALWSVMALTKARASWEAERMLSTRPCWKRRMEALS